MRAVQKVFIIAIFLYGAFMVFYYNRAIKFGRSIEERISERLSVIDDINTPKPQINSPTSEENANLETTGPSLTARDQNDPNLDLLIQKLETERSRETQDYVISKNSIEDLQKMNPFDLLGAYPKIDSLYIREFREDVSKFDLYRDDDYCDRVDAYNLANPENIFNKKTFFTNFPPSHVPTSIMSKIGTVTIGELDPNVTKNQLTSRKYHLTPEINIFYVSAANLYYNYEIGKHFACATQSFNHIPGQWKLVSKDSVLTLFECNSFETKNNVHSNYVEKYKNKPQCFNKSTLFPKSYRLFDEKECKQFFRIIRSKQYQESLKDQPIQYIIKVSRGSHQSSGIFILNKEEERYLNGDYKGGADCGKYDAPLLAQTYITNPLLLDNDNKFDFRIYMLIASTNPFIAYYHDGFLRVAMNKFDKYSNEKSVHLTNTHIAIEKMVQAREGNKTSEIDERQLQDSIWWTLEKFQNYLFESKKISDPNWLDNYLRPAFKKALIHLVRMSKDILWQQSNVFELYGVDFMLDDKMQLWFIESNPNPQVTGFTPAKNDLYISIVMGTLDIQSAYYKSRMKRALKVIMDMQEDLKNNPAFDLKKWKLEYQNAVKNRLDEYKIHEMNKFVPIMDENLPGAAAYFGYLPEECVDTE